MKKKNIVILCIIFLITVCILIISICYDYKNYKKLSSKTDAIVTSVKITTDEDNNNYYRLEYEFEANNKMYSGKYSGGQQYNVGDLISIKYDPNKPENNCEQKTDKSIMSAITSFVSLIIIWSEIAYIEQKTVHKEDIKKCFISINRIFKLLLWITLLSVIPTIIVTICNINYYVMSSINCLVYFSFTGNLMFVIIYAITNKTVNKIKNDPKLFEQIKNGKEINCGEFRIYFTDSYLVNLSTRLHVINYSDILLISKEISCGTKAMLDTHYILIVNKKFKKISIAVSLFTKTEEYETIMEEIEKRVPNVLKGYSKENKQIIEEMKKMRR